MATTEAPKAVHSLVLDAAPILTNTPSVSTLISQAQNLYTVPSVLSEIRDPVARQRVETTLLPFLKVRTPRPTSVKAITDFARRTGDLEVLSRPDIQILALAYELECERNLGDWRLRRLPGQQRLNGPPPPELKERDKILGGEPAAEETQVKEGEAETAEAVAAVLDTDAIPTPAKEEAVAILESTGLTLADKETELAEAVETIRDAELSLPTPAKEEALEVVEAELEKLNIEVAEAAETPETAAPEETTEEAAAEEDIDDDEGWITPSNIKAVQAQDDASTSPEPEVKVMQAAVITNDFAMQNVALRMNLNLLNPSLTRIRTLKTWVLRCHACFDITRDMGKQFCSRCGKPTLLRTSCSTDKDGKFTVHLKKNFQFNKRGDRFSVPKPVAGSANTRIQGGGKGGWGNELILAEDQKEYVAAMAREKRRKEKDLMDEDYLPGLLTGRRDGGVHGKPKVGGGRNVNSKKRH
jgi:RNA-binding protein NOB1